jgi:hypothetical protein
MQFYTRQHKYDCGKFSSRLLIRRDIDLHTKKMYVCTMDEKGEVREHRNMNTNPESFLTAIAPYREDIVVVVECMFTWYWIADLCQKEGIPFVLGHALYMKAIHGGKAKNHKIDSKKIAVLLRGGMIPQSYEDAGNTELMRRRNHLMRRRAELLSHIENTNSQYNLEDSFGSISRPYQRRGKDLVGAFDHPAVQKSIEVNLKMTATYHVFLEDVERNILKLAQHHEPVSVRKRHIPSHPRQTALHH